MSLTKVTYSMIQGAPVNAFDYMSAAQINDVQTRAATLDVSSAIQDAIDANPGREVFLPSGTYRCESPLVMGDGNVYNILSGEGFPAFEKGTLLDFINCNGIEFKNTFQSVSNLYLKGDKTGGAINPDTLTFGNIGIYISGAGATSGSGSGIMNVSITGFDTGLATEDTTAFAGAYFILTNININGCVVGCAFTQTTTQININGGNIRNCTKHGLYTGPSGSLYQSVMLNNVLMETCGTDVTGVAGTSITNSGICIRGVCKFGMFGGYLEEVRNIFVDQFCSATFRKTWIQNVTNMYGQGEIDMSDAAGVEGYTISTNYDVSTFTNTNVTATLTNTGANPNCYRIQSSTAPGSTVATSITVPIPASGNINVDSISVVNVAKTVLCWVKVQFQVKYVNTLPAAMGEFNSGNPLSPLISAIGYTGSDGQPNSAICDVNAFNCSDGEWHQITQIKQVRSGSPYITDTLKEFVWLLDFTNGAWNSSALDMYLKAPVITIYTQNGQAA